MTPAQQKALIYDEIGLGNVQPLPAGLNQSKGAKLDWSTYKGQALDPNYVRDLQRTQMEIRDKMREQINRWLGR